MKCEIEEDYGAGTFGCRGKVTYFIVGMNGHPGARCETHIDEVYRKWYTSFREISLEEFMAASVISQ
jgi:hypothetical protein